MSEQGTSVADHIKWSETVKKLIKTEHITHSLSSHLSCKKLKINPKKVSHSSNLSAGRNQHSANSCDVASFAHTHTYLLPSFIFWEKKETERENKETWRRKDRDISVFGQGQRNKELWLTKTSHHHGHPGAAGPLKWSKARQRPFRNRYTQNT